MELFSSVHSIRGCFWTDFLFTLLAVLVNGVLIFGYTGALRVVTSLIRRRVGHRIDTLLTGWIGTPVHELSHCIACWLFGHKVTRVIWFDPDGTSGAIGKVQHQARKNNPWNRIGDFFIGIAPFVGGTVIIGLVAEYGLKFDLLEPAPQVEPDAAFLVMLQSQVAKLVSGGGNLLTQFFRVENLADWNFWIFTYLVFAIGMHMLPSPSDFKITSEGLARAICSFCLVVLASGLFGETVHRYVRCAVAQLSAVSCNVLCFVLLLCGTLLLAIEVLKVAGDTFRRLKIIFRGGK